MRFRLRTLLILMAIAPPLLAAVWLSRTETLAAVQRSPPENWGRLFLWLVAAIVVAAEFHRRAKV
jgi:hypothetical protein